MADPRDAERPPQHRRPQTGNPPQTEKDAPTISPLVSTPRGIRQLSTRSAAIFQSCERRTRSARNEHFRATEGSPQRARPSPVHVDQKATRTRRATTPGQQQAASSARGGWRGVAGYDCPLNPLWPSGYSLSKPDEPWEGRSASLVCNNMPYLPFL